MIWFNYIYSQCIHNASIYLYLKKLSGLEICNFLSRHFKMSFKSRAGKKQAFWFTLWYVHWQRQKPCEVATVLRCTIYNWALQKQLIITETKTKNNNNNNNYKNSFQTSSSASLRLSVHAKFLYKSSKVVFFIYSTVRIQKWKALAMFGMRLWVFKIK